MSCTGPPRGVALDDSRKRARPPGSVTAGSGAPEPAFRSTGSPETGKPSESVTVAVTTAVESAPRPNATYSGEARSWLGCGARIGYCHIGLPRDLASGRRPNLELMLARATHAGQPKDRDPAVVRDSCPLLLSTLRSVAV